MSDKMTVEELAVDLESWTPDSKALHDQAAAKLRELDKGNGDLCGRINRLHVENGILQAEIAKLRESAVDCDRLNKGFGELSKGWGELLDDRRAWFEEKERLRAEIAELRKTATDYAAIEALTVSERFDKKEWAYHAMSEELRIHPYSDKHRRDFYGTLPEASRKCRAELEVEQGPGKPISRAEALQYSRWALARAERERQGLGRGKSALDKCCAAERFEPKDMLIQNAMGEIRDRFEALEGSTP